VPLSWRWLQYSAETEMKESPYPRRNPVSQYFCYMMDRVFVLVQAKEFFMLAIETTVSIDNHRLVIQDKILPAYAEQARVIVMWNPSPVGGRRSPPPALAGMGEEKGDILNSVPIAASASFLCHAQSPCGR
jgi:hypothetical protein